MNVKIKLSHFRLSHSRAPFCVAYMRETLEMVLAAHVQAFRFYGGSCRKGIYDNLKTVVSNVLVGFDRDRYSAEAACAGKIVTVRAYADRISLHHHGKLVGLHRRQYGRDRTIYIPWHYLSVLKQKPGALRNGAPFQGWELPLALRKARERLGQIADGDKQFVGTLAVIPCYGIGAVEQACKKALLCRTISRDLVLNILSRGNEPQPTTAYQTPDHLPQLSLFPAADCNRYNRLLSGGRYAS